MIEGDVDVAEAASTVLVLRVGRSGACWLAKLAEGPSRRVQSFTSSTPSLKPRTVSR